MFTNSLFLVIPADGLSERLQQSVQDGSTVPDHKKVPTDSFVGAQAEDSVQMNGTQN